ncbi:hypothetical protein Dimus_024961 [Dionaea muscipula]
MIGRPWAKASCNLKPTSLYIMWSPKEATFSSLQQRITRDLNKIPIQSLIIATMSGPLSAASSIERLSILKPSAYHQQHEASSSPQQSIICHPTRNKKRLARRCKWPNSNQEQARSEDGPEEEEAAAESDKRAIRGEQLTRGDSGDQRAVEPASTDEHARARDRSRLLFDSAAAGLHQGEVDHEEHVCIFLCPLACTSCGAQKKQPSAACNSNHAQPNSIPIQPPIIATAGGPLSAASSIERLSILKPSAYHQQHEASSSPQQSIICHPTRNKKQPPRSRNWPNSNQE